MKISVKSMDAVSKSPMSLTKEIVIKRPIPDSKTFEEEPTSVEVIEKNLDEIFTK